MLGLRALRFRIFGLRVFQIRVKGFGFRAARPTPAIFVTGTSWIYLILYLVLLGDAGSRSSAEWDTVQCWGLFV